MISNDFNDVNLCPCISDFGVVFLIMCVFVRVPGCWLILYLEALILVHG